MDREHTDQEAIEATPGRRRPVRPLLIGGIVGACVLGAGLGLWARPGADERRFAPPQPPPVQAQAEPARTLQIVKTEGPPPVAQPLEVLTVTPGKTPQVSAKLLPLAALPKTPPPGLVKVDAPKTAQVAVTAATVAAVAAADAAARPKPDPKAQLAAAQAARAEQAAAKAKAQARMAALAKAKAERKAQLAAAAKAKAERQVQLAQAARAKKQKAHQLQLAKLKAAKEAKALRFAKLKAAHEAKLERLAEAKRQAADKVRAQEEARAQAREDQKKSTRLAALVRTLRAVVHRQQADAARSAHEKRETLQAPSHNNGLVKVNATSSRCASADPGAALACADPGLAAADRQMARAYRQAEAAGVPEGELRSQQSRWLAARAAAAREAPWAVRDVYQARIAELNDMTRQAHEPQ